MWQLSQMLKMIRHEKSLTAKQQDDVAKQGGLLIAAISEALTNIDEAEEEGEAEEEEEEAGDTEESECKTKQRSLLQPEMDVRVFGAVINEIKVQLNRNRKRPREEQEMWLEKNGQRDASR